MDADNENVATIGLIGKSGFLIAYVTRISVYALWGLENGWAEPADSCSAQRTCN